MDSFTCSPIHNLCATLAGARPVDMAVSDESEADNIIAYNGRCGIEVGGSDTFGNSFTQNSIHDNDGAGICLLEGGSETTGRMAGCGQVRGDL